MNEEKLKKAQNKLISKLNEEQPINIIPNDSDDYDEDDDEDEDSDESSFSNDSNEDNFLD